MEKNISKSQLQRMCLTFGKLLPNQSGTDEHERIIKIEDAAYRAQGAGRWNYDDVITALVQTAKGGNPEQILSYFLGLQGSGEAESKTRIFRKVLASTEILQGQFIEVGSRNIQLGDGVVLHITYDCSFKVDETSYCVLLFPRIDVIKEKARDALISEFSQPFPGMTGDYFLLFVEAPKIRDRRQPKITKRKFEHSSTSEEFRDHLRRSKLYMGDDQLSLF